MGWSSLLITYKIYLQTKTLRYIMILYNTYYGTDFPDWDWDWDTGTLGHRQRATAVVPGSCLAGNPQ